MMPDALRTVARALLAAALAWLLPPARPALAQPGGGVVSASARTQFTRVHPGDRFAIAAVLTIQPGWHIWPDSGQGRVPRGAEGLVPVWTRIGPGEGPRWTSDPDAQPGSFTVDGVTAYFGSAQWPAPHETTTAGLSGSPLTLLAFEGQIVVYVPVTVADDAMPGARRLRLLVQVQACDDSTCLPPEDLEATVSFEIVPKDTPRTDAPDPLFAPFDPSVFGRLGVPGSIFVHAAEDDVPVDFLGARFTVPPWMIWLIAFGAGLILNLTPCVLPVVPIKVMSLQHHAKDRARLVLFGTVYCAGIIAFFGVLAVLVGLLGQAWGQLNGAWWFSVPLAIVVAAMGLSMLGAFTLRLPQSVYMLNPSGDTVAGNFLLGALTAVLSTPCTGPMLGSVLGWAATQPAVIGIVSVLVMGAGMASPYALLIAFPKLIDRVPRGGPGGELLKQVLGLFMLAAAVYILSFLTPETWTWWFVGFFCAAAFAWMYVGGLRVLRGTNAKIVVTHAAIAGLIVTVIATRAMTEADDPAPTGGSSGAIPWRVFRSDRDGSIRDAVAEALSDGKVVVMDFTAKWCPNCHVIERTILNSDAGRRVLTHDRVVPIKVDITSSSYTEGYAVLKEISGTASIPFLAVVGPARAWDRPVTFSSFFKPSDLAAAVGEAAGPGGVAFGDRPVELPSR